MKKFIIILAAVALFGVGFYTIKKITVRNPVEVSEPTPTVMVFPTISDDIFVELIARSDNKAVELRLSGLPIDLESVEYELTYDTDSGLPRGVLGKIITDGKSQITRDDIVLGTCSSGKCVYDSGVDKVNLSLKFNGADGIKVFQKEYIL